MYGLENGHQDVAKELQKNAAYAEWWRKGDPDQNRGQVSQYADPWLHESW